jgi:phosphoenolpyruvate carboxylase
MRNDTPNHHKYPAALQAKINTLLDQGFQQIQDDFTLMMDCLSEILADFGKAQFQSILPVVGNPHHINDMHLETQTEAVSILSLALQLLNVVEQHATNTFRKAVATTVGHEYVSGSLAEVLATLRRHGQSWESIIGVWQSLYLQLVFTAHPTESRRASLIGQLGQFFTDLQDSQGQPETRRRLILKNIECLLGTGEFIQHKPSVDTERDFITRTIVGSLPEGLSLLEQDVSKAFRALGCPESMIPRVSEYPLIRFRSWVASDRDGHPYVNATETQLSLDRNRTEVLTLISQSLHDLAAILSLSRHRVKVPSKLQEALNRQNPTLTEIPEEPWRVFCQHLATQIDTLSPEQLMAELRILEDTLHEAGAHHLAHETSLVVLKIKTFGFHLVAQDIRQNSDAYLAALSWILDQAGLDGKAYVAMSDSARCQFIAAELSSPRPFLPQDYPLTGPAKDALESLRVAAKTLKKHGPAPIGSLIVSMTRQSSDLLQVLLFAREAGLLDYSQNPPICALPIVPLIETAEDHRNIISILTGFLENDIVAASVAFAHKKNGIQPFERPQGPPFERPQGPPFDCAQEPAMLPNAPDVPFLGQCGVAALHKLNENGADGVFRNRSKPGIRIMCGHSDGGKDAGIIDNFRMMRETRGKVTNFLEKKGYAPIFFEGIGGTLIRGAAPIKYLIANSLPAHRVGGFEYTEQGQVIAQNHLVPFMSAWTLQNALAALLQHESELQDPVPHAWFKDATQVASRHYRELVHSPEFTPFFTHATPLDLLEFSRMGSRPTRRTGANTLSDLRAIPFALCQSQSRFNFTAWYGVGTMLAHLKKAESQHFELLCHQLKTFPDIEFSLTNVEMALKSASLDWMTAYATLEPNDTLRNTIMTKLTAEYTLTTQMLDTVFGSSFENRRPRLATTIAKRKDMLDVLHQVQIAAIRAWRNAQKNSDPNEEQWLITGLMTINAISNGLRGTG